MSISWMIWHKNWHKKSSPILCYFIYVSTKACNTWVKNMVRKNQITHLIRTNTLVIKAHLILITIRLATPRTISNISTFIINISLWLISIKLACGCPGECFCLGDDVIHFIIAKAWALIALRYFAVWLFQPAKPNAEFRADSLPVPALIVGGSLIAFFVLQLMWTFSIVIAPWA